MVSWSVSCKVLATRSWKLGIKEALGLVRKKTAYPHGVRPKYPMVSRCLPWAVVACIHLSRVL